MYRPKNKPQINPEHATGLELKDQIDNYPLGH
ncbi:MAG: cbb3-type cytochrome oxidase subunit 3 [Patiriisocius sp.]|jgi:cbb3-type cytochrome oxidase subunit 3